MKHIFVYNNYMLKIIYKITWIPICISSHYSSSHNSLKENNIILNIFYSTLRLFNEQLFILFLKINYFVVFGAKHSQLVSHFILSINQLTPNTLKYIQNNTFSHRKCYAKIQKKKMYNYKYYKTISENIEITT